MNSIMNLTDTQNWTFIVTAALVVLAAYFDYRQRRIPNFLTLTAMAVGVTIHGLSGGWVGLSYSLWGLILGIGVFTVLYFLGGLGAGDVKLMGGVGSLLGANLMISVFVFTALVGGIMALYKMIANRSFRQTKSRLSRLNIRRERYDPVTDTIPYGFAIAIGTLVTLTIQILPEVVA
jgi:prepilin peptidase CpaA